MQLHNDARLVLIYGTQGRCCPFCRTTSQLLKVKLHDLYGMV